MKNKIFTVLIAQILFVCTQLNAQNFTNTDYKKALWITARMYGGQRSGLNNWLLNNHLPSGLAEKYRGTAFIEDKDTDGYDLSGGWHDCGDHVKFGQTEFYSAYMLLKGYAEFPTGYDDKYAYDYAGYATAGDWTFEGTGHVPNGVPDILDEVKHATDYFIKCARNSTTFYYQVGDGGPDHAKWETATKMQTETSANGGQTRSVFKNPADASMPSFCGATLALMSRLYRKFDPTYADKCLVAAKYAYDYAKAHPGVVPDAQGGTFYGANDNWKDDYASMCAELYWATGTAAYKTEAQSYTFSAAAGQGKDIYGKSYGFDYSNNGDIAIYNLALLGTSGAAAAFKSLVSQFYLNNTQSDGQFNGGNTGWGPLRYNGNTALMVALDIKMNGAQTNSKKFIYDNIDYILGKNSSSLSFIVGFGANSPKHPHHRNVYLRDDNPTDANKPSMTIPTKNAQHGYMVGGTRTVSTFSDNVVNYQHTEGGIDYNACLVGALGYINSQLAPVDTTKFGHKSPNLGASQSICGLTSITLNSNIATDGKKTFTWQKDGTTVQAASTTANTYKITAAGTYTCILDSAGLWNTKGSVVISGVLPVVTLGADQVLCSPATVTLDLGIAGYTYQWKKNGAVLSGATSQTYTIYTAGTYIGSISASGCASKYDTVVVTSKLPTVTNDTICKAGTANLAVSGSGGPYEWYSSTTSTTVLTTGTTYKPSISASTTYYIKDASSVSATAGPSSTNNPLSTPSNGGSVGFRFTAAKAFTITQMKVLPYVYSCGATDVVTVTFTLAQGATTVGTYTSTAVACSGTTNATTFYTLNFATPISVPAAGSYTLTPSGGNALGWSSTGANFTTMDASGVMDITDDTRDDQAASFPSIFDIVIQAGSTCDRAPVSAVINGTLAKCNVTEIEDLTTEHISVYPNPSEHNFTLQGIENAEVKVYDNFGKQVLQFHSSNSSTFGNNLTSGVYHVVVSENGTVHQSINIVKQ